MCAKTRTPILHTPVGVAESGWATVVEPPLEPELEPLKEISIWLFKIWEPKTTTFGGIYCTAPFKISVRFTHTLLVGAQCHA